MYIDLNDPYLRMNTERIEQGHNDYLMMCSPPTFEDLSSPHKYVNDLQIPEDEDIPQTSGYLSMKPDDSIFSPRLPEEGQVFTFNTKKPNERTDSDTEPESIPMLEIHRESGYESQTIHSPTLTSFYNPSYHLPPKIKEGEEVVIKSSDNYVNMPQNKLKGEKEMKNEHNYVNSNTRDWDRIPV